MNQFDSSDVAELADAAGHKPYRSNLCAGSNPASLESNSLTVGGEVAAREREKVKPLAPTVNDPRHILTYAAAMTAALNQAQGITK